MKMIYADNAAGMPLSKKACAAMQNAADMAANPNSTHAAGRKAANLIEEARMYIAKSFGIHASGVYFTSGGAEANAMAALSLCKAVNAKKRQGICSAIEHKTIIDSLNAKKNDIINNSTEFNLVFVKPDANGFVCAQKIAANANSSTAFASLMFVNNETGVLQDISNTGIFCKDNNILFHCDAVSAAGNMRIDMQAMSIDMLSISAHKFGGPAGVGALLCGQGIKPAALMHGGSQEMGRRAGTQNVLGICGMHAALAESFENMACNNAKTLRALECFEAEISKINNSRVLGKSAVRNGAISCVYFGQLPAIKLASLLDLQGICVSAGAACTAGQAAYSHVARAMGLSEFDAAHTLRVSFSHNNTVEQAKQIAQAINEIINYWEK